MDELQAKKQQLEALLRGLGSVAVAYSAGVDSTFLLAAAHAALGDRVLAVTARAPIFPAEESEDAARFCAAQGIRQMFVDYEPLAVPGFAANPSDRCYLCKRALFGKIVVIAAAQGIPYVAEGSNLDDLGDYRPGLRAVAELGIQSPLRAAGLTKADIRALSKQMGLPTWSKPSFACLASRFVYGETITPEKLDMVEQAERFLRAHGFAQVRVRVHGDLARIEVPPGDLARLAGMAPDVECALRGLGFAYAALDLGGYRTGSMNRTLDL